MQKVESASDPKGMKNAFLQVLIGLGDAADRRRLSGLRGSVAFGGPAFLGRDRRCAEPVRSMERTLTASQGGPLGGWDPWMLAVDLTEACSWSRTIR